jgi:hypothetical protein
MQRSKSHVAVHLAKVAIWNGAVHLSHCRRSFVFGIRARMCPFEQVRGFGCTIGMLLSTGFIIYDMLGFIGIFVYIPFAMLSLLGIFFLFFFF